ncbi:MAG TPA: SulP family inorganic anion transporter, partial [Aestuariivirgaceae bacterium]|nr:SulP family inorganic anion transporter [Aestuariivirgaceae bacterium]
FMTGISLSILVGQIGRFTGLKIESDGLLRPIIELTAKVSLIHWPSVVLGSAMLFLLLAHTRMRKLLPVPGPVLVVVLSVVLSVMFDFAGHGIRVVGDIPGKLPSLALPWPLGVSLDTLIVDALAVWLVSFSSGIVTARAFGAQGHYRVDASRELTGFAAANVASGLFGGFPVTSSDSRTAINLSVGGKTQLAGLASAAALVAILLYLNPLLRLLPAPALGAILAAAAIGLMDFNGLAKLWNVSRNEFVFAIIGLIGPLVFGVLTGIVIAVGATLAYLLYQGMRPRLAMMGRAKGRPGFYKLHRVKGSAPVPGLAICLVEDSLLFFSTDHVKEQIESAAEKLPPETRWFVLDASSIPRVDVTAAMALIEIAQDLARRGLKLGIAELHSEPLAVLTAAGVVDVIGKKMVFASLDDMLLAFNGQ